MSVKKDASGRRSIQVDSRGARHAGRGLAGNCDRTRHLGVVCARRIRRREWQARRRHVGFRSGYGLTFRRHGVESASITSPEKAQAGCRAHRRSPPSSVLKRARAATCVVRIVQSLFASTDDWDGQLTGAEEGWPGITRVLRIYLSHFPRTGLRHHAPHGTCRQAPPLRRGTTLTTSRRRSRARALGQRWCRTQPAPRRLRGVADHISDQSIGRTCWCSIRRGLAPPHSAPSSSATMVMATLTCYMYGDQAAEHVARETPRWQTWMQTSLPRCQPTAR
jgi:hypothetical protein